MGKREVEVEVVAVRLLADGEDPATASQELLDGMRAVEDSATVVLLRTNTLREGRRVLQRFTYRRQA